MHKLLGFLMTIPLLLLLSCTFQKKQAAAPLEAVPFVDLTRYIGQWYEISRYPHRFQEGCFGSRATYSMREDGKIAVLNECYEGSFSNLIPCICTSWLLASLPVHYRVRVCNVLMP